VHVTCTYLPNFIQVELRQGSYDVISIFQNGGHGVAILIPVACLVINCTRLIYLNPRLNNYYFRFSKTNGRHIGIFLPVYNLTNFLRRVTIHAKVISIY